MTSLRERLAAKQRRRLVVPIQITDPSVDQQAWMGVAAAIEIQRGKDEPDQAVLANLEQQLEAANQRVQQHFADIELQSLPPAEYEAARGEWLDEDGNLNWAEALAPLLEVSCVDPDLRDADYWRELMSGDTWTEGDTNALRMAILHLNIYAPDVRIPKG